MKTILNYKEYYFSNALTPDTYILAALLPIIFMLTYLLVTIRTRYFKNSSTIDIALAALAGGVGLPLSIAFFRPVEQYIYFQF